MHILIVKLKNPNSSYKHSKLATKNRPFSRKTPTYIAHAFCQKMDNLGPKEIIDLSTPYCSTTKQLLNASFIFEIRRS